MMKMEEEDSWMIERRDLQIDAFAEIITGAKFRLDRFFNFFRQEHFTTLSIHLDH